MQSIKQYITGALVMAALVLTAHFALPRAYAQAQAQEQAPTTTPPPM